MQKNSTELIKCCFKCNLELPTASFNKNGRTKDGLQSCCRECTSRYGKAWYAADRAHSAKVVRRSFMRFYGTVHGRAAHLWNNARNRSRSLKVPFNLTVEWVENRVGAGVCEVTGLPFVLSKLGAGKGHRVNSFSPSLDRLVPDRGYVMDNVQVVCWIYNRAKGAFPVADLVRMAAALIAKQAPRELTVAELAELRRVGQEFHAQYEQIRTEAEAERGTARRRFRRAAWLQLQP